MALLKVEETALVMIDLQERLVPAMSGAAAVLDRCGLLLRGAAELGMDVIVTEQYPKGLGPTLPEIAGLLPANTPVIAKTGFSVFAEPAFRTELQSRRRRTLIVAGIEAHVCVYQSITDALERGFRVVAAADAVTSRRPADAEAALAQSGRLGAEILSAEAILFLLLGDAAAPHFKAISRLVR